QVREHEPRVRPQADSGDGPPRKTRLAQQSGQLGLGREVGGAGTLAGWIVRELDQSVAPRTRDAGEVHETRLRIRKQLEDLDRVHRVVRATEDLLQPRLADVSALEVEVREVPQRALQLAHVALGDVHQRDRADLPREVERGEAAAGTDLQQIHRARQGQVLEQHLVA